MLSSIKRKIREQIEFHAADQLCNLLHTLPTKYGFEVVELPRIEKRNPIGKIIEPFVRLGLKKENKAFPVGIKVSYYKRDISFQVYAKNIGGCFCNGICYKSRNIMSDKKWLEEVFYLFDIACRIKKYGFFSAYTASMGGSILKADGKCVGINLNGECVHRDDIINIMGIRVWNSVAGESGAETEEGYIDGSVFHSYKTNSVMHFIKDKQIIENVTYNYACGVQEAKRFYDSI